MTWRKVLYTSQGVPDNYVDESFLRDLKTNPTKKEGTVMEAMTGTTVVTMELSNVCMFGAIYIFLEWDLFCPTSLLLVSSMVTVLFYAVYTYTSKCEDSLTMGTRCARDAKMVTIFILFGFGLAPILKTLTETVSTDTIYAMAVFTLLAHLVFHDYGPYGAIVSSSLSLNAAIFATVCLVSRLTTTWHAFVLLTISVELFALFPLFRHHVKSHCSQWLWPLAVLSVGVACATIAFISSLLLLPFLFTVFFINVVCPCWFVQWQKYKNNIYGPWDEAIIKS